MAERIFRRKIYEQMLNWKQNQHGTTALLIRGARRVSKSKHTVPGSTSFLEQCSKRGVGESDHLLRPRSFLYSSEPHLSREGLV